MTRTPADAPDTVTAEGMARVNAAAMIALAGRTFTSVYDQKRVITFKS